VGCYGSYTVVQLPGNDESTGHRKTHPGAIFVGGVGFGIYFFLLLASGKWWILGPRERVRCTTPLRLLCSLLLLSCFSTPFLAIYLFSLLSLFFFLLILHSHTGKHRFSGYRLHFHSLGWKSQHEISMYVITKTLYKIHIRGFLQLEMRGAQNARETNTQSSRQRDTRHNRRQQQSKTNSARLEQTTARNPIAGIQPSLLLSPSLVDPLSPNKNTSSWRGLFLLDARRM